MTIGWGAYSGRWASPASRQWNSDTFPVEPEPFRPSAFDNPLPRRQDGVSEVQVNLLLTTLAVVAATVVQRDPIFTPIAKRPAPQAEQYQNLLLTTLATAPQAPFKPADMANPARRAATQQSEIWQASPDLYYTLYAPTSELWPNPPARLRQAQVEQAQMFPGITAAAPSAPFKPADFEVPRARARAQADAAQNLLSTLLAPVAPPDTSTIFRQPSTTPIPGRKRVPEWEYTNRLPLTSTVAASPFTPAPMPDPVRRVWIQPADVQQGLLVQVYTELYAPQDNLWPNPPARPRPGLSEQQQMFPGLTAAPAASPFIPQDFGLPSARVRVPGFDAQNLQLTLLAPAAPADTQVKRDPIFTSITWRTSHPAYLGEQPLNLLTSTLGGGVTPPATDSDWLVRTRRRRN